MFDQLAVFRFSPEGVDHEELELELIDHGLEEMADGLGDDGSKQLLVRCPRGSFGTMHSALDERGIKVLTSGMEWVPRTHTQLEDGQVDDVLKLVERLEADDDVQHVFHNLG